MIVAMLEHATEDQIQDVTDHLMRMGFAVHRTTGARQSVLAAVGKRIDFDTRDLEVLPGVEKVASHQRALQAGRQAVPRTRQIIKLANGPNRRQRSRRHGRTLLGRIARADIPVCRTGREGRSQSAARRSLQASQLAVYVSGNGPGRD